MSVRAQHGFEVARACDDFSITRTPDDIAQFLIDEVLGKPRGRFNYLPADSGVREILKGVPAVAVRARCLRSGAPAGRKANSDAIAAVSHLLLEMKGPCFAVGNLAVRFFRSKHGDFYVKLRVPLVRRRGDRDCFVVTQFRKGFRPSRAQMGFYASMIMLWLAEEGFVNPTLEFLVADAPEGCSDRVGRIVPIEALPHFGETEINFWLGRYVAACDLLLKEYPAAFASELRGYQIYDPDQEGLFR